MLTLAVLGACTKPPHMMLILDVDAPVLGQLAAHPELSEDAAVDRIRIDVLDSTDLERPLDSCELPAGNPSSWPISFGIVPDQDRRILLLVRAFRRRFALPTERHDQRRSCGRVADGPVLLLEPPPEITISRLIEVPQNSTMQRFRVLLRMSCMGIPPAFPVLDLPATTCIDEEHTSVAPSQGIETITEEGMPTSVAGTAPLASEVPCSAPQPPGSMCIKGGFSVQGEQRLRELGMRRNSPVPLRPVWLSPFYLDISEFTLGQFRSLPRDRLHEEPLRGGQLKTGDSCLWDQGRDNMPLNCVSWRLANAVCKTVHPYGRLPTEAEWEHAARGRGQGRLYPWGDRAPTCCTASLGRELPSLPSCGIGIEPGSMHTGEDCQDGDISRDGILDMGGSLREFTADSEAPYAERCGLRQGISENPVCERKGTHAARGGSWRGWLAATPLRWLYGDDPDDDLGLRCRYPGVR